MLFAEWLKMYSQLEVVTSYIIIVLCTRSESLAVSVRDASITFASKLTS